MKSARPSRGSHAPGTFWYYNNWDFNALGTIYTTQTGKKIGDAFHSQIARPIGMVDFDPAQDMRYQYEESVSRHPAYKFRISARDLARFGLLFLHDGMWGDERILPPGWVTTSTSVHSLASQSGTKSGYGLMWWVTAEGDHGLPVGSYTASGSGGQRLTVIPSIDTIIVHLMNTNQRGGPRIGTSTYNKLVSTIIAARLPPR